MNFQMFPYQLDYDKCSEERQRRRVSYLPDVRTDRREKSVEGASRLKMSTATFTDS